MDAHGTLGHRCGRRSSRLLEAASFVSVCFSSRCRGVAPGRGVGGPTAPLPIDPYLLLSWACPERGLLGQELRAVRASWRTTVTTATCPDDGWVEPDHDVVQCPGPLRSKGIPHPALRGLAYKKNKNTG